MNRIFLLLIVAVGMFGCKSQPSESKGTTTVTSGWNPPAAGVVVDKYEERITEDKLNQSYFRVIVKATDSSKAGHYAVEMDRGENKNQTDIDLPKWSGGVVLKPVLKKGDKPYECFLGFDIGDGTFKDLYQIKVDEKNSIVMKQITGYYQ